jgi:phage terminase Nu1 subunit (DNA packaging protein)
MVVFQLPFFNRRQIRLWQGIAAFRGGGSGRLRVFMTAAFCGYFAAVKAQPGTANGVNNRNFELTKG